MVVPPIVKLPKFGAGVRYLCQEQLLLLVGVGTVEERLELPRPPCQDAQVRGVDPALFVVVRDDVAPPSALDDRGTPPLEPTTERSVGLALGVVPEAPALVGREVHLGRSAGLPPGLDAGHRPVRDLNGA